MKNYQFLKHLPMHGPNVLQSSVKCLEDFFIKTLEQTQTNAAGHEFIIFSFYQFSSKQKVG